LYLGSHPQAHALKVEIKRTHSYRNFPYNIKGSRVLKNKKIKNKNCHIVPFFPTGKILSGTGSPFFLVAKIQNFVKNNHVKDGLLRKLIKQVAPSCKHISKNYPGTSTN
jgi:hypothetical protein